MNNTSKEDSMKKLIIFLISLFILCACSSPASGSGTGNGSGNAAQKQDEMIADRIVPTKAVDLSGKMISRNFDNIFSVTIPENWNITVGGADWYLWIRLYDPAEPALQVFTTISTTGILKSDRAKEYYEYCYNLTGDNYLYGPTSAMVVNSSATMEEYFEDYMDYIDWIAKYDPTFSGFDFPLIKDFQKIESWDVDDSYSSIAMASSSSDSGLFITCMLKGSTLISISLPTSKSLVECTSHSKPPAWTSIS